MFPKFDEKMSVQQKFEKLIKSIQKRAEQEDKSYAVFVDEMPPLFFESCPQYEKFFQTLLAECPLVHIFMAISPSGRNLTQPIDVKFVGNQFYVKQLRTRHRNSFLLSSFLIHLTY